MLKHRWSALLLFALLAGMGRAQKAPLSHLVQQLPTDVQAVAPGIYLIDFGRVAFGNLSLTPARGAAGPVTVRFGESLKDGRIDRNPPGTVRYAEVEVTPNGTAPMIVAPPADKRNTTAPAVRTPEAWGVLMPFRWVEIEGWPSPPQRDSVERRAFFDSSWSDNAASFHSSDPMLDRIWDLCHYSIKATTFAGVFVDGDRERLAYEADAYLNQLGYYAGDANPEMPRATFDRLVQYPTWPTEWAPHMVFIAHADWTETGDRAWLSTHYEVLKTKLLAERVGPDGLVTSSPQQIRRGDIVDWPQSERDGYVFTGINTVVNAFHLRALQQMSELAAALGRQGEAAAFAQQQRRALDAFQARLFDAQQGLYRDGAGTDHTSLHANLFPLAFGLVPADKSAHIAEWLASRGMAGSVYAAQYLLEALFEHGQSTAALHLITAPGDRSWAHMVNAGTTITWEAWDNKYKPNQDWNHAWGAAPANLLPAFVLGAKPLTPGWRQALIQPHAGDLSFAEGKLPTPLGEVQIAWTRASTFTLNVTLPPGMTATIKLPALPGSTGVLSGGRRVKASREGDWWVMEKQVAGTVRIAEQMATRAGKS